jgi:hypothetical protein
MERISLLFTRFFAITVINIKKALFIFIPIFCSFLYANAQGL